MNLENPKLHIAGLIVVGLGLLAISLFSSVKVKQNTYQGNNYSISYPSNISVAQRELSGGGTALVFNPPPGKNFRMRLDVLAKTRTSVEDTTWMFRVFKYQESNIQLNGRRAKKFTGSLKLEPETIQEMATIFEDSASVYNLWLKYDAPIRDAEIDSLYEQILSSFNFYQ